MPIWHKTPVDSTHGDNTLIFAVQKPIDFYKTWGHLIIFFISLVKLVDLFDV